jgi:hypothetical protein
MVIALILLIIFSIVVTAFFFHRSSHPYSESVPPVSIRAFLFSLWLVAAAMWGRGFYQYKVAGLFDLTIERALFIAVLFILTAGLISDSPIVRGKRSIELLLFLLCLICVVSMTVHGFAPTSPKNPSPWNIFISAYLFPIAAYLFAKKYLVAERDIAFLFQALFYLALYLGIMAFFEFYDLRQYVYPRFINDPKVWLHLDRARGPFLNSALNGFTLIIGFLCGVHLLAFKRGVARLLHLFLMSVFFPAVFFTLTRSIYLCFLLTLGTLLFAYRTEFPKWRLLAFPLAAVLIFALMNLPRLASSERREGGVYQVTEVRLREALIKRSVIMVTDNPVFGVGLAQFIPASVARYKGLVSIPETAEEQTQHFQLLNIAVELGLVGVSVYLGIIVLFFRRVYSLFLGLPKSGFIDSNLALLIGVALGVYVLNNFFIDSSFQLFPNAVFFTFGGLADGLYCRLEMGQMAMEEAIPLGLSSTLPA